MLHQNCTMLRRKKVRRYSLSLITGKEIEEGSEWETSPCGVPLFGKDDQTAGICKSCADGWTHPENFPVPVEK